MALTRGQLWRSAGEEGGRLDRSGFKSKQKKRESRQLTDGRSLLYMEQRNGSGPEAGQERIR